MTGNDMNISLFSWINGLPHFPWLDPIAVFVGNIQQKEAGGLLGAVFLYGVLFKKRNVWLGSLVLASAFWFVNETVDTLKPLLDQPRPYDILQNVILLGGKPSSRAFPASAAALASLLFFYIYFMTRKHLLLWAALVFILGVGRVYQGLHFPGDILGGWALGISTAWVAYGVYRFIQKRLISWNR